MLRTSLRRRAAQGVAEARAGRADVLCAPAQCTPAASACAAASLRAPLAAPPPLSPSALAPRRCASSSAAAGGVRKPSGAAGASPSRLSGWLGAAPPNIEHIAAAIDAYLPQTAKRELEQRVLKDACRMIVSPAGSVRLASRSALVVRTAIASPALRREVAPIFDRIYGTPLGSDGYVRALSGNGPAGAAAGARSGGAARAEGRPAYTPSSDWMLRVTRAHPELHEWITLFTEWRIATALLHPAADLLPGKSLAAVAAEAAASEAAAAAAAGTLAGGSSLPEPPASDALHTSPDRSTQWLLDGGWSKAEAGSIVAAVREEAKLVVYALCHFMYRAKLQAKDAAPSAAAPPAVKAAADASPVSPSSSRAGTGKQRADGSTTYGVATPPPHAGGAAGGAAAPSPMTNAFGRPLGEPAFQLPDAFVALRDELSALSWAGGAPATSAVESFHTAAAAALAELSATAQERACAALALPMVAVYLSLAHEAAASVRAVVAASEVDARRLAGTLLRELQDVAKVSARESKLAAGIADKNARVEAIMKKHVLYPHVVDMMLSPSTAAPDVVAPLIHRHYAEWTPAPIPDSAAPSASAPAAHAAPADVPMSVMLSVADTLRVGAGTVYAPNAWWRALLTLFPAPAHAPLLTHFLPREARPLVFSAAQRDSLPQSLRSFTGIFHHALTTLRATCGDIAALRAHRLAEAARAKAAAAAAATAAAAEADAAVAAAAAGGTAAGARTPVVRPTSDADIPAPAPGSLRYAACVVGGNNYGQLVHGAKRLLSMLSAVYTPRDRFEFRAIVRELEAYRMSAAGKAAASDLMKRHAYDADMDMWRFVDMMEGDTTKALLARAHELLPHKHRIAVYPLLMKYMGTLRVADVDARLFAMRDAVSGLHSPAAATATATAAAAAAAPAPLPAATPAAASTSWTGVLKHLSAAPLGSATAAPPASASASASAGVQALTAAGGGVGAVSARREAARVGAAAALTPTAAFEFARKLCAVLNAKDLARVRKALRFYFRQVNKLTKLREHAQQALALADAQAALQVSSGEAAASGAGAATDRDKTMNASLSKALARQDPALALSHVESALRERHTTVVRIANTIFGPLSFALDEPFDKFVSAGLLRPDVLDDAKRISVLEDAHQAIAEELLLDEEATVNGIDSPDDLLFHVQQSAAAAAASAATPAAPPSDDSVDGAATPAADGVGVQAAGGVDADASVRALSKLNAVSTTFQSAVLPILLHATRPTAPATATATAEDVTSAGTHTAGGAHAAAAHAALLDDMRTLGAARLSAPVATPAATPASAPPAADASPSASGFVVSGSVGPAPRPLRLVGPWGAPLPSDRWESQGVCTSDSLFADEPPSPRGARTADEERVQPRVAGGASLSGVELDAGASDDELLPDDGDSDADADAGEGGAGAEASAEGALEGSASDKPLVSIPTDSQRARQYFAQAVTLPLRFSAVRMHTSVTAPSVRSFSARGVVGDTVSTPTGGNITLMTYRTSTSEVEAPNAIAKERIARAVRASARPTSAAAAAKATPVVMPPASAESALMIDSYNVLTGRVEGARASEVDVAADLGEWNTAAWVARKVFIGRLPLDTSAADIARVLDKAIGKVVRVELWQERAEALQQRLAQQEHLAALRSKWQEKYRAEMKRKAEASASAAIVSMSTKKGGGSSSSSSSNSSSAAGATGSAAKRAGGVSKKAASSKAASQPKSSAAKGGASPSAAIAAGITAAATKAATAPSTSAALHSSSVLRSWMCSQASTPLLYSLLSDDALPGRRRASSTAGGAAPAAADDDDDAPSSGVSEEWKQRVTTLFEEAPPRADSPAATAPAASAAAATTPGGASAASAAGGAKRDGSAKTGKEAAQQQATRRFYKVLEERRRKQNLDSPLHAFVYFDSPAAASVATSEILRMFGIVIHNHACRTEVASEKRALYVGNLPRGMPPEAVQLAMNSMLDDMGYSVRLVDHTRLRHGMVTNGEIYVEFPSHAEAARAAVFLRGAELVAGVPLTVGWTSPDEWRQAKPKLPVYF